MPYEPYRYYEELEKPVAKVFDAMSTRGICVDLQYLNSLRKTLEGQKDPLVERIKKDLGDINIGSPKQLLGALHEKGYEPELKGKPSTDKRALERYKGSPIIDALFEYSEIDTLLSSFVYPYLERNQSVIYPRFSQTGTRTGRPSCSNPNLLNVPKRTENGKLVRRMFVPRQGMDMWDSDYKQIEPKCLAVLSKDEAMLQLFNDGVDFHTYFANGLNIGRDKAKVFDLETYYRATAFGVSDTLKCSQEEAQKEIDKAWALFPRLKRWEEDLIYTAKRNGYVTTLFGRRIKVDNLDNTEFFVNKKTGQKVFWKRNAAERQMMNNIGQGSAAEIMKFGMIKLYNRTDLSPTSGVMIQVYDALTGETPDIARDMPIVKECMEKAVALDIPLTVDFKVGKNWAEVYNEEN